MTTARQVIVDFLKSKGGYVHSCDIHNHVIQAGYRRNSSQGSLSKMVESGQVLRKGIYKDTLCALNPDYQPSAVSLRQIANHQHLGLKVQPAARKPEPQNAVFDEYRMNSWMYEMDKSLREVRNAANLVHP